MTVNPLALLPLLMLAAASAALSVTALSLAMPQGVRLDVVEVTLAVTALCVSIGLAFDRYGIVAGIGVIAVALLAHGGLRSRITPRIERMAAWASTAALLAYISQI